MKRVTLKNTKGLKAYLSNNPYKYEVVNNGCSIALYYHDLPELFSIAAHFGTWAAHNPQLVSIEELDQRGDIMGL